MAKSRHNRNQTFKKNQQLSTLLFPDEHVIIADLQKATHTLNQIITEYGLTISAQKTKSMAFKGRDSVRTKIVVDNKIMEKVKVKVKQSRYGPGVAQRVPGS